VGLVRSAHVHAGPARALVHGLKYRGIAAAAGILAEAMSPLVPDGTVLVPVPRVTWRLIRYGVDPARELALELSRRTGSRVASPLRAPLWGRPRAGREHGFAPGFRVTATAAGLPVLLVDDVVTTGATLAAAAHLLPGVYGAVTATAAPGRAGSVAAAVTSRSSPPGD
jgi:predicted amidophosphoribosyltransferase